jgi:hypothetical protein
VRSCYPPRALATATERLLRPRDVDGIFSDFVRNANALGRQARTTKAPSGAPSAFEASLEAGPMTIPAPRRFDLEESVPIQVEDDHEHVDPEVLAEGSGAFESLVPPPGDDTAKHEALQVVPDVKSVRPPEPAPRERSEDGEIPPRELERLMDDMGVLLRYGHDAEVHARLEALLREFPRDLLLLRRIAEFHLQSGQEQPAVDCLYRLARGLFERRNVVGMRAALEQILVLRPDDSRAHRLLGLLERRAD